MQMLATILSALFAGLGAMAIFWPRAVLGIGASLSTPGGLLTSAALRVVFGAVLLMAAPLSRAPKLLRVGGVLMLVAGLSTPLFGVEIAKRLYELASYDGETWLRITGTLAVALGALFVWALSPRQHMPRRD